MTKIARLILLIFLTFQSTFGQTNNLILTSEQNSKWFDSLKTLTLDQQLSTIKVRLLADTNIFDRQFYNDRIRVVEPIGNKVYGDGKPTIMIDGYVMFIDNKTASEKIIRLTKLLDTTHIKTLLILSDKDPASVAMCGKLNGLLLMTSTKKKYSKKFRQIKLQQNN